MQNGNAVQQVVSLSALYRSSTWAVRLAWVASRRLVVTRMVIVVLRSLLPALFILCVRGLVDGFQQSSDIAANATWLVMLPLLILMGALLSSVADYVNVRLKDELANTINLGFLKQATRLDLAFFEDPAKQDMMSRAKHNSTRHCEILVTDVAEFGRNLLQLIVLTGVVIAISPVTAVVLSTLAIPYGFVQIRMSLLRYWREHLRAQKIRWTNYYNAMLTSHDSIPEIRAFNLAPLFIDRYRKLVIGFRDENRSIQRRFLVADVLFGTIFTATLSLLGFWVVTRALSGAVSMGNVAALLLAAERLYSTVSQQIRVLSRIVHSGMMVSNLREFHDAEASLVSEGSTEANNISGSIEFQNISFRYPGSDGMILDDLSFSVEAGEVVALVGPNGAGKSTLVKLLAHLYSPDTGIIRLDGYDVRELTDRTLHSNIAFVMQSFARYETTVQENIAYGKWEQLLGDTEAVREIAKRMGIDEMIASLPHGYKTLVGRMFGEVTLSGGQWQSIAIARALASDARIIVLDEPTSGLDPRKEFEIFMKFRELVRGRTALIISHRFSTVRMADRILVLDEGRLVENATHEELIVSGGMYAQMYNLHRQLLDGAVVDKA